MNEERTRKEIFTLDEAALIVDVFENMLEKYGMRLPSPEDDEREADNGAALYGSTYSDILDAVENALIGILAWQKAPGCVVIPGVFSSTM